MVSCAAPCRSHGLLLTSKAAARDSYPARLFFAPDFAGVRSCRGRGGRRRGGRRCRGSHYSCGCSDDSADGCSWLVSFRVSHSRNANGNVTVLVVRMTPPLKDAKPVAEKRGSKASSKEVRFQSSAKYPIILPISCQA